MIPKTVWRNAATPRTLPPMRNAELDPLVRSAITGDRPERCVVELNLSGNSLKSDETVVRRCQGTVATGIFDVVFEDGFAVATIREEACLRDVGVPRRATRKIAHLHPGQPVHFLLNGKIDGHCERFYCLADDYLVLCTGLEAQWDRIREIDLQEDLY